MKFKILFILFSIFLKDVNSFRNPFYFNDESQDIENRKELEEISVLAINSSGKKLGAILKKGIYKEVVFVADNIWGYKVKSIAIDKVQLVSPNGEIHNLYFD